MLRVGVEPNGSELSQLREASESPLHQIAA